MIIRSCNPVSMRHQAPRVGTITMPYHVQGTQRVEEADARRLLQQTSSELIKV